MSNYVWKGTRSSTTPRRVVPVFKEGPWPKPSSPTPIVGKLPWGAKLFIAVVGGGLTYACYANGFPNAAIFFGFPTLLLILKG